MDKKLQAFIGIMLVYAVLTYLVFPVGFYYLINKSLVSAGHGFIVGSLVSIALWLGVGRKMV
jgi:hypothetical protein